MTTRRRDAMGDDVSENLRTVARKIRDAKIEQDGGYRRVLLVQAEEGIEHIIAGLAQPASVGGVDMRDEIARLIEPVAWADFDAKGYDSGRTRRDREWSLERADTIITRLTAQLNEARAENERNRQGFEFHAGRAERERERANAAEAALAKSRTEAERLKAEVAQLKSAPVPKSEPNLKGSHVYPEE